MQKRASFFLFFKYTFMFLSFLLLGGVNVDTKCLIDLTQPLSKTFFLFDFACQFLHFLFQALHRLLRANLGELPLVRIAGQMEKVLMVLEQGRTM